MSQVFSQCYRIYLEDTDAGGIVYHANHLRLFERCRRDWLRELGMTHYFYQSQSQDNTKNLSHGLPDIQFVVSEATIKYHRPILLDSLVDVSVVDLTLKNSSLILDQRIHFNEQILSQAQITLACVSTTKDEQGRTQVRPTRLPTPFVDLVKGAM